jgi:hypothetical protein
MSSARPPINPQLDDLLARTRQPDLPAGLAARIVAQTANLPQQTRREDIVAQVHSSAMSGTPEPSNDRGWIRGVAPFAGLAAAAMLAVIIAPSLFVRAPAPSIPEVSPVARSQPEATIPAVSPAPSVDARVAAAPPVKAARLPHSVRSAQKADAARREEQAAPSPDTVLAASSERKAADPVVPAAPERVAQVDGPKAPVQGPPVPFDLLPSGSSTIGLGVAGSSEPAASPPPSNSPGRGPGGPGGGFGHGGGPRR